MSIFEKQRFEIWNQAQHPYKHTLADFGYSNEALPGVTNVESAMNWLIAVLYPTAKPAVANPAALPLVGNSLGDYRVVLDDGDGKAAGYRWEQREGDVAALWYKILDIDFSTDSVLAAVTNTTQELFVVRRGRQDMDSAGAVVTGLYAGQTIYGGTVAGQNLTLRANSGDGVGASTGFVQVGDNFRPDVTATWNLGSSANRWLNSYVSNSSEIGTLTLSGGSITDSSGAISFGNENLTTTGSVTAASALVSGTIEVGPFAGSALILGAGSITDESGAISFGNENLTTTGTLNSGVITVIVGSELLVLNADLGGNASITSSLGIIDFDASILQGTTGLSFDYADFLTYVTAGTLGMDTNRIYSSAVNGSIVFLPSGTGIVDVQGPLTTLGITTTGTHSVTGQLNADNLRLDGNVLSATNTNGNVTITPDGTGVVEVTAPLRASSDAARDLGTSALRFKDLYLSGVISDGTTSISQATIQSLRDINVGVSAGMSLFYDGAKWVASVPDTEIDHGTVSGLLDDDHTQYALLAGRAGGQVLIGGTAASNNLRLQSTSNATRGVIQFSDDLEPETNASFSGSWSGTDIGGGSFFFRDLFMRGEARNLRFENFTFATLPGFSAQNIGRVMYATDTQKAYIDTGAAVKVLGVSKFVSDTAWNGSDTTKDVDVSADIGDARQAIWAIHDNSSDFERIYCSIKAISATTVRITVSPALPAGSYRLIGVE